MFRIKKEGIILRPTKRKFENEGVLNPACMQVGNEVHMFYRAVKKGNFSSIGYCRLEGPLKVVERSKKPILVPEHNYESHGIEDPRIVKIDGTYYMTYTGYDGKSVRISYATSTDLKNWKKKGPLIPKITYDD